MCTQAFLAVLLDEKKFVLIQNWEIEVLSLVTIPLEMGLSPLKPEAKSHNHIIKSDQLFLILKLYSLQMQTLTCAFADHGMLYQYYYQYFKLPIFQILSSSSFWCISKEFLSLESLHCLLLNYHNL